MTADGSDDDKIKVLEKLREVKPDATIDTVEQAKDREDATFIVYLSDSDNSDSDADELDPETNNNNVDEEDAIRILMKSKVMRFRMKKKMQTVLSLGRSA